MSSEVVEKLRAYRQEFEALGVEHLRLFGSVARGDAHKDSDVDLVVNYKPGFRPGLEFIRLKRRLEEILDRPVDLLRAPISRPELRKTIDQEGVNAF